MSDPTRRSARLRLGTLAFVCLAVALAAIASYGLFRISQYPTERAAAFRRALSVAGLPPQDLIMVERELLQYETDSQIKIWVAEAQAVGGLVLLLGLVFTWRNLRATQMKLDVDREGQLTNRFTQAAGQLGAELKDGSPNVPVRLGGIYALSRIADYSPRDYNSIIDILTAYVRYNAPWNPSEDPSIRSPAGSKPRTDVQAILRVLGLAESRGRRLDLRGTDLRGAEFWDAHFEETDFWGAHMEGAQLWGAHLERSKLDFAHLDGANLRGAKLMGASVKNVCLKDADLRDADFRDAVGLTKETVESAKDRGKGAVLPEAFLNRGVTSSSALDVP